MKRALMSVLAIGLIGLVGCKDDKKKNPDVRKRAAAPAKRAVKKVTTITVYAGRSKRLVKPLIKMFTKATGVQVKVKYAKTAQLALLLQQEIKAGSAHADVFWAQDAGALGLLEKQFQAVSEAIQTKVPKIFQQPERLWVATSGRARVLAYSPKKIKVKKLPKSVFDLTKRKWRGKVGWAPTNASFQAFVTAMRVAHGDKKTTKWLKAMKKNKTKSYPKNTAIVKAIAAGEVTLGLPNHYYLLRFKSKDKKFPVEQTFFKDGNIGNLVNIAGVGVLKSSKQAKAAMQFVSFLLSKEAQQYVTNTIFEYPVLAGVKPAAYLLPLDALLKKTPKISLGKLRDLKGTLTLMRGAGVP